MGRDFEGVERVARAAVGASFQNAPRCCRNWANAAFMEETTRMNHRQQPLGKAVYLGRTAHPATRQPRGITDDPCSWCGRRPVIGWVSRYDPSSSGRDWVLCSNCWRRLQAQEQREQARRAMSISPGERQRLMWLARVEELS